MSEKPKAPLTLDDLPLADLSQWLNDNQLPDGSAFLLPGSVGESSITAETWDGLPYLTGWSDFGSGYQPGQHAVDALGFVHLRGLVTHTAAYSFPASVCTLPPGSRPALPELFTQQMADVTTGMVVGDVRIRTDGVVFINTAVPYPSGTGATFLTLSGITFKAGG